jgi:hypothetical protein
MIGTGSCALSETIQLTRAAVRAGVGHVVILPPFYYKAPSDEGLLTFFKSVLDQTVLNQSATKVLLYHFPRVAGVGFSNALVQQLVNAYPEHVIGMKDSSGDKDHLADVCKLLPNFQVGCVMFLLYPIRWLLSVVCACLDVCWLGGDIACFCAARCGRMHLGHCGRACFLLVKRERSLTRGDTVYGAGDARCGRHSEHASAG